ncbi:hypothetical protein N7456_006929 [Penicillium angulare]|uniref:Uncharacterized protein n=1 Tax=Penicillium angulare TaxID=116970 RepID=A0A9W9KDC4_9EURO|nr:hypothetical protein N7456_006929 [Penicillium angulare]
MTASPNCVLNANLAFEETPLDSSIDFSNVSENRVTMIIGRGQMVYWQGSNVTVYEVDDEGNEQTRKLVGMPNGQGVARDGIKLYITKGKVTESA